MLAQVLQDQNRRGCEQQGAARRFPGFVCHISCPPGMLDVTARPDKTAVQFTSWAPVLAAVRAAAMHAWHQYVPLGLLTKWRAHASAPALSHPQEVAQPAVMPAAVAPLGLTERIAAEGGSVRQGAGAAACGGAAAAGGAEDRVGPRAHGRVTLTLDGGAAADCMEADLASEQHHAAASRQPRTHGGLKGGFPWLSAQGSACGGGLPYADKPGMIHRQETGMASCGLSFWPREDQDSAAVHGTGPSVLRRAEGAHPAYCKAPEMHELDMSDARQDLKDWDSEACNGRDQMAQRTSEEAQLAECRPRCMQKADMTDAWGGMSSPARDSKDLNCQQSPSSAAFAAQLPQSPTLDMPLGARTHTGAQTAMLHRQPQLSFHVRRRPCDPSQLHPDHDFRAQARKEDSWCMQFGQAQLNSSSAPADAEYLQSATGSMASPGRQDMAAAHVDGWIWTDDGASGELAAALCTVEEKRQRFVQERNELESGPSAALSHAEQQQRHRREDSLHEDCGTERDVGIHGSRCRRAGGGRCANSAPAHHHPRMCAAHTTPVFSLCSSGGRGNAAHALQDQLALSKAACPASEHDAQTSGHEPARKRRRRGMLTHSGACSRPGLAETSKADPLQLCNEEPSTVQHRELLGDATFERSSAPAASHAVEPRMTSSGPAKERSPDQSAQDEEEAVEMEGDALMQAPARRRRPQRAANGSRADVLASLAGANSAEPAGKVCQEEPPPLLQLGNDQVDKQAQVGGAQLLQSLQIDAGGNAAGVGEKGAARGTAEAVARSGKSVAELLREWVNPACVSGQRQVPDLASLACGNLLGLVPAAITKESLDTARPLRQVCSIITPVAFKTVRCGCHHLV